MSAGGHEAIAGAAAIQGKSRATEALRIGLLTGADDRSYALGLATALMARGVALDFIGSDEIDGPELHGHPLVRFLNLRGDQSRDARAWRKALRILRYYLRLLAYAARSDAKVFHVLWNNKFEHFDRTILMLFYRLCRRRVVLTAHNVNAAKRDGRDSALNRLTLRIQYRLCDHVFVHTAQMRDDLVADFRISGERISVIPFGINNTTPNTTLTRLQARERIGLQAGNHTMLFFGQIAPYKGLEHLVAALPSALAHDPSLHLVIAGKVKSGCEGYWSAIEHSLETNPELARHVTLHIRHVPDAEVEVYFKAADVLVIPYVQIFQSGVPFLAYSYGLPVIATDVGPLRDDIVEGRTGMVCRPRDPADLARAIGAFFITPMFRESVRTRLDIQEHANDRHSWTKVAAVSENVYLRARQTR